jgi:hypothetical protein
MSGSIRGPARPALLVSVVVVVLTLSACGSSGPGLPASTSREPSRSVALPSRTPVATPTQPATPPRTVAAVPTPEPATPAATQTQAVVATSSSTTSTPAWLWWLIGAVVLAIAVTVAVLLRRRGRRRAWAEQLSAAAAELTWFSRELIPQLGQAASVQQMLGGWQISAGRVIALEDRLTALEAEAVDESRRSQARALRGAVRGARTHLDALSTAWDMSAAVNHLQAAAAELEATLASVGQSAQLAPTVGPRAQ